MAVVDWGVGVEMEAEVDVWSRVAPCDQSGRGYLLTPEMPDEKKCEY
jgi:hypothetical protein